MKSSHAISLLFTVPVLFSFGCRSSEPVGAGDEAVNSEEAAAAPSQESGPLRDALDWLAAHQAEDGRWDADGFGVECGKASKTTCEDPGQVQNDVAATGLALLAFLGAGHTQDHGDYQHEVARGIKWLRNSQDRSTGLIGSKASHEFLYNHAIAALALSEAYNATKSPLLKPTCQRAINYIQLARNPYGAWRYDEPPMGENDTSVTGWMILALKSAERAKLNIDHDAYECTLLWLDEVTDLSTGRVGYNTNGSTSARIVMINDHFPPEKGEAMTAIGLATRMQLGQTDTSEHPILKQHGELILRSLPVWEADDYANDMYYWYHGTLAMQALGGTYKEKWQASMHKAILTGQVQFGHARGSWDPIGPWGTSGGRVYSTAMMAMCLEQLLELEFDFTLTDEPAGSDEEPEEEEPMAGLQYGAAHSG